MNIDLCSLIVGCCCDSLGAFWSCADKEEAEKLYQEGEEIKHKTKVGILCSTPIYFHKGK